MQCEIGVVGNGAVGKAAALGLAQAGFRVALVCPSDASMVARKITPDWDARVYALNHSAQQLLGKLKVWDALDWQRVAPIESMNVVDVGGGRVELDAYAAHQTELAWIVEDQNINHALDAALRFAPDVKMIAGKTLAMSADFSELTLDNGVTVTAQLWVAADGAQSWMRNYAEIGFDYRSYGQQGVVANFSCAKPHHGVAHQWFLGDEGVVALLPLPGQHVSLVWSAPDALASMLLAEDVSLLAGRLGHYCEGVLGELTPLPSQRALSFPLSLVRPHSMVGTRLALVGDAAHVVHPLAGHGLNLGFGDVAALLDVIAERESWRSCGDERVLKRYARARKEEVMLMQLATDGLARLFGSALTPMQTMRQAGLNLVNGLPFLKKKLMQHAMGS